MKTSSSPRLFTVALACAALVACNQIIGLEVGELGAGGGASTSTVASTTASTTGAGGDGGQGGQLAAIPTDGLLLWFDSDQGLTVEDGGVVSWRDISGNNLGAGQAQAGSRPTLGAIAGRPALSFDGVDDSLNLAVIDADLSTGLSLFAVVQRDDIVLDCQPVLQLSNGEEVDDVSFQLTSEAGLLYEIDGSYLTAPSSVSADTPTLLGFHHEPPNAEIRVDGVGFAFGPFVEVPAIVRGLNLIGDGLYSGCSAWSGLIGEILLYARPLTPEEITEVQTYLQTKWSCCD